MIRAVPAWLATVIVGVAGFAFWELSLVVTSPENFVLPAPSAMVAALFENWSEIWVGVKVTGFIIITGLIGGVVVGVTGALLVTRFRLAKEILTPLAVAVSAIPIIALAPVLQNWFGLGSPRSNQIIVALLVLFPVFINMSRGLTEVEPSQVELMESYAASPWTITKEVRIPNSLPFLFSALRLSSSLAVIAAIVAEYFGGRQDALGNQITGAAGLARYDEAWAAVLAGTAIGTLIYIVVVALERGLMPWHSTNRE